MSTAPLKSALAKVARERDVYRRAARDFEEALDNVRAALGLESTHWLVIADQVEDVVRARELLTRELAQAQSDVKVAEAFSNECLRVWNLPSEEAKARFAAAVEMRKKVLDEAARIAHAYTDGIASKCCASVAHGIAAKIEALKDDGK